MEPVGDARSQDLPEQGCVSTLANTQAFSARNGEQAFRPTLSQLTSQIGGPAGGWYRIAAGASNHLDMHPDQHEFYFIHRGTATLVLGDETTRLAPGDTVFVPRGVEHRIVNDADEAFELFYFFAPAASPHPERDATRFPVVTFAPTELADR